MDLSEGTGAADQRRRGSRRGDIESFDVLGVPVSVTTLDSASEVIHRWSEDSTGRFVCIRDVHGIMQAQQNANLLALHYEAAMVTPDGMPLVWIARLRGLPVSRTCGPDLMDRALSDSEASGLKHYFYGGKPGVASELVKRFLAKYPRLHVAGAETPPFNSIEGEELQALASRLAASGADVVWIGLSTPKQEYLMQRLHSLVPATLIGVGAAFDFHSGVIQRAPRWMQHVGLEWLYRLAKEPSRLWRRYLIMAPKFVFTLYLKRNSRNRK